jgi:hypothetical protein
MKTLIAQAIRRMIAISAVHRKSQTTESNRTKKTLKSRKPALIQAKLKSTLTKTTTRKSKTAL